MIRSAPRWLVLALSVLMAVSTAVAKKPHKSSCGPAKSNARFEPNKPNEPFDPIDPPIKVEVRDVTLDLNDARLVRNSEADWFDSPAPASTSVPESKVRTWNGGLPVDHLKGKSNEPVEPWVEELAREERDGAVFSSYIEALRADGIVSADSTTYSESQRLGTFQIDSGGDRPLGTLNLIVYFDSEKAKNEMECVIKESGVNPERYSFTAPISSVGKWTLKINLDPLSINEIGCVLEAAGYQRLRPTLGSPSLEPSLHVTRPEMLKIVPSPEDELFPD